MVTADGLGNLYRVMDLPRLPDADCGVDKVIKDLLGIEDQVREATRFAGGEGVVVWGRRKNMLAEARVRCTEQRIFVAFVSSPARRPGHADPDRFFESFTVRQGRKK